MAVSVRPALAEIPAYVPARTIRSVQEELGIERIIKLAGNENNLGCSPKVPEALAGVYDQLARYPDYTNTELLKRLTVKHGVADDELVFGNGSFELLSVIGQTFLAPELESIIPEPSFGWYKNVTQQAGAKTVSVPLKDHAVDLPGILAAITPKTRIIWLCNPNNPTGTVYDHSTIHRFLEQVPKNILVVLDEAYIDFARIPDAVDSAKLIHEFDNVIALRTFSKLYGLASLRLGYGIASRDIIAKLYRVKLPINVNLAAQAAAAASLDDTEFQAKVLENNRQGLELYFRTLTELGLDFIPSHGNFIMFDTGLDSKYVVNAYLQKGILLRGGDEFGMNGWLRVTIGTPEENQYVLDILRELLADTSHIS
jgi:histidinol-phosphate aminotransferase